MTSCLNDARLQAVIDGEGTAEEAEHLRACGACSARAAAARAAMAAFARGMERVSVPPLLGMQVAAAVARAEGGRRGATTLREAPAPMSRRAWLFGTGVAAVAAGLVFVVLPALDPGTRLNAAEILNRSLQTLSVNGTERLRYELSIDAPSSASVEAGTFHIEQLVDHETGRWRLARFDADWTLLNGMAEDPTTNSRQAVVRMDGRSYRFHFDITDAERLPLWDLQRRYAESAIRMVQASGAQVTSTDTADGPAYVVELPRAEAADVPSVFDLQHARVVVDADDYHIVEFNVEGDAFGERLAVRYRLIERIVWGPPGLPDAEFELPRDSDAIEFRGDGTRQPPRDVMALVLRELARRRP